MAETTSEIKNTLSSLGIRSIWDVLIGDKPIWIIYLVLSCFSLVVVYSSSSMVIFHGGEFNSTNVLIKQFGLLAVGILIAAGTAWLVYRYEPKILRKSAYAIYIVAIILLIMTYIPSFAPEINGAHRWVNIFGFSIQPSEVAKMALVILAAKIMAKYRGELDNTRKVLWPIIITSGIAALLVVKSNFSSALFLIFIMIYMMYIGRLPWKHIGLTLLGVMGIGMMALLLILTCPEPAAKVLPRLKTWNTRVVSFSPALEQFAYKVEGENDKKKTSHVDNHQIRQSKIAVAEGMSFGKGPGNSTQRYKLSQAYCDFIYAIIIEEWGWIGAILTVLTYLWLLIRVLVLVKRTDRCFDTMVIVGLMFIIVAQAFLHMGVVVNLLPATGQTLPIISSGGSSLFITSIEFGIILGISKYNKEQSETNKETKE